MRFLAGFFAAAVALLMALLVLRFENAQSLAIAVSDLGKFGFYLGLYSDLLCVLLITLPTLLLWHLGRARLATGLWCLGALSLFAGVLSDTLYMKFFGDRLHLWIVTKHFSDLFVVGGSAGSLAESLNVIAAVLFFVASIVAAIVLARRQWHTLVSSRQRRWIAAVLTLSTVVLGVLLAPTSIKERLVFGLRSKILADNIFDIWRKEFFDAEMAVFNSATVLHGNIKTVRQEVASLDIAQSVQQLKAYRDHKKPATQSSSIDTLLYKLPSTPELTGDLRQSLGFTPDQKINVIVLFLESTRGYEILHPELGPVVFPEITRLLNNHALWVPQVYSVAVEPGMTVRGQFSSLCSMLPNINGPAPYIAYPALRITCLAELFRQRGYRTTWFSGFEKSYHNKDAFESLHGTQEFHDHDYFEQNGVTEKLGWGLADGPMLQQVHKRLVEIHEEGDNFFANVVTLSTHHPFEYTEQGALPQKLIDETQVAKNYTGYLSELRYEDSAVGAFFETLFAGPLADNTLVVMLGDHSLSKKPHHPLSLSAKQENRFRIVVGFLSKNIVQAKRLPWYASQIDVAPTIAGVVGLSGEVSWLGRNMLLGPGSPFVFRASRRLHYRTTDTLCHTAKNATQPVCWEVTPAMDPMFDEQGPVKAEDPATSAFFQNTLDATRQLIVLNQLEPKIRRQALLTNP